jgi:hypothetical protein
MAFKLGLYTTLLFAIIITIHKWDFSNQKKIIVYNASSGKAIDFIDGNAYHSVGDSHMVTVGLLQNFHLKSGRISYRIHKKIDNDFPIFQKNNFLQFYDKKILAIDSAFTYGSLPQK